MVEIEQYSECDTLMAGRNNMSGSEGRFKCETLDEVTKLLEEKLTVFLWTHSDTIIHVRNGKVTATFASGNAAARAARV